MNKEYKVGDFYRVYDGKKFLVRYIAKTVKDANDFCEEHEDTGVIAGDEKSGHIIICNLKESPKGDKK
jgi:hypothetical protein